MAAKYVYFFGKGKAEGKGTEKVLLGGKGAGLAEMTHLGLPVPAGFTITTECCDLYYKNDKRWPAGLEDQIRTNLAKLDKVAGKKLGDPNDPLLISVRSGAAASMPGMMETILNLGLNDQSVEGLATGSGDRRFAMDAYRRFITMYGSTAKGVARSKFDDALNEIKERRTRPRIGKPDDQAVLDTEVDAEELAELVGQLKSIYQESTGEPFPQDPFEQIVGAINAVFGSWMADKAVTYRRVEKLAGLAGTAVNVMQMVFGNMGADSGTGVCFTRDPSTGENEFYGDLLMNAQGEDVVAGIRTPLKLAELKTLQPEIYDQLEAVRVLLETHYKDMQDLEFTVERGVLYMLQCRTGKRSPAAVFRIAVEQATKPLLSKKLLDRLAKRGYLPQTIAATAAGPVITREQAIARIKPEDIERLFSPIVDPAYDPQKLREAQIGEGVNAVPGAATGRVVFTAEDAERAAAKEEKVILVRKETSPEDVGGMHAAQGILTATGGKTSHAAVVARGWGKCCIVGCEGLRINERAQSLTLNGRTIGAGDFITLDGSSGAVYAGEMPLINPQPPKEFYTLMKWCDEIRRLKVRTNADTPADAANAVRMGAEGIGLCRTEHMFFETEERRLAIQEMIMADDKPSRRAALDKLLPFQRGDFEGIFEAMKGRPVTIRLIDPPLHEFLPKDAAAVERLSRSTGLSPEEIRHRAEGLHESNPMLGHRGCRLCVTFPEILEMQVRAIMEAAVACRRRKVPVSPEIMIPLSIDPKELKLLIDRTRAVAEEVLAGEKIKVPYLVGTMIETPRAALLGDRLAESADFFSFGTNDLTQTTMALSRDDATRFLPAYVDQSGAAIFKMDPFQSLDQDGVGLLVRWAIERGRGIKPALKIGICGEHGGELHSVKFCDRVGMDYVSCSPYRVPVARLAAAQAALEAKAQAKAPARKNAATKRKEKPILKDSASAARKPAGKLRGDRSPKETKRIGPAKKTKPASASRATSRGRK